MLALSRDERQRAREKARHEELNKMPEPVRKWVAELEKAGRSQAASLRKQESQRLKPLQGQAERVEADINRLASELTQAQAWLSDIPRDAQQSESVSYFTTSQLWPERISAAREELAAIRAEMRKIESQTSREIDALRLHLTVPMREASRHLQLWELILED